VRLRPLLIVVALLAGSVVSAEQFGSRVRFKAPPVIVSGGGGGVGCNGPCVFSISFAVADGWTQAGGQLLSGGGGAICNSLGWSFGGHQSIVHEGGSSYINATDGCALLETAANYASGGGGFGFRQRVINGTNGNAGGIVIEAATSQTKLWLSYRIRYDSNFTLAAGYGKEFASYTGGGAHYAITGIENGVMGLTIDGSTLVSSSTSWASHMGSNRSDGQWHCHEIAMDISGQKVQSWLDGVAVVDATGVNWRGVTDISSWQVTVNYSSVSNCPANGCAVDIDDIAGDNDLTWGQRLGCPGAGG
jgi:hypothetical protein